MSLDLVAAALWLDMKPQRKLVLVSICENADQDGFCWPSQKYISTRASLSMRSVIPHLRELEKDGWIETVRKGRFWRSTERVVNVSRILAEGEARRTTFQEERQREVSARRERQGEGAALQGEDSALQGEVAASNVKLLRREPSYRTVIGESSKENRGTDNLTDEADFLERRYERSGKGGLR